MFLWVINPSGLTICILIYYLENRDYNIIYIFMVYLDDDINIRQLALYVGDIRYICLMLYNILRLNLKII